MDHISKGQRSALMSRVKNRNTTPEKWVRSWLHRNGYGFRIHRNDLPGCPDIVLSKYKTVIFVHGCFWHQHKDCKRSTVPQTNTEFWATKLQKNMTRDLENSQKLKNLGWKVLIVWQCKIKDLEWLHEKICNNGDSAYDG